MGALGDETSKRFGERDESRRNGEPTSPLGLKPFFSTLLERKETDTARKPKAVKYQGWQKGIDSSESELRVQCEPLLLRFSPLPRLPTVWHPSKPNSNKSPFESSMVEVWKQGGRDSVRRRRVGVVEGGTRVALLSSTARRDF